MTSRYNLRSNKKNKIKQEEPKEIKNDNLIFLKVRHSWSFGYATENTSLPNIIRIPRIDNTKIYDFFFERDIPLSEVKKTLDNVIPKDAVNIINKDLELIYVKEKYTIPIKDKNETKKSETYPCIGFKTIFCDIDNKKLCDIMNDTELANEKIVLYVHTSGSYSVPYTCIVS